MKISLALLVAGPTPPVNIGLLMLLQQLNEDISLTVSNLTAEQRAEVFGPRNMLVLLV